MVGQLVNRKLFVDKNRKTGQQAKLTYPYYWSYVLYNLTGESTCHGYGFVNLQ